MGRCGNWFPDDAFGYLGTAFFVAYMVSNAFSGLVINKLGTRLGYALCMGGALFQALSGNTVKTLSESMGILPLTIIFS